MKESDESTEPQPAEWPELSFEEKTLELVRKLLNEKGIKATDLHLIKTDPDGNEQIFRETID